MKVIFHGIIEKRRRGCNCGKVFGDSKLVTMRSFILPSGITRVFRAGIEETVSDADGEFLLTLKYIGADGTEQNAFEEVS